MLLEIKDLTKDYGDVRALDHLTLALQPGEVFGLLGPNGSGKSTALRLLLGFLKPTSGQARIHGYDCWRDSVQARRHIAYLPGELRLYENMNGNQLIRFLCDLRSVQPDENYTQLADSFDIDLTRPLKNMSSGMKRKVALLAILTPKSPLLILDEPTNTLDPSMRDILLEQLESAKRNGQAVLFSSHVLTEVEQVCDRVGILKHGKLVHLQAMSDVVQMRRIEAHFENPIDDELELPGLLKREWSDAHAVWQYNGDLEPVLRWLAQHPVSDLRVESQGLAPIYHRYHGTEVC